VGYAGETAMSEKVRILATEVLGLHGRNLDTAICVLVLYTDDTLFYVTMLEGQAHARLFGMPIYTGDSYLQACKEMENTKTFRKGGGFTRMNGIFSEEYLERQISENTPVAATKYVCTDNYGLEAMLDTGAVYECRKHSISGLLYVTDKDGNRIECFASRFKKA
jgi:hypothetical protein